MKSPVTVFVILLVCTIYVDATSLKRVCYYSFLGFKQGNLTPDKLNATLCTHVNFAFSVVYNNSIITRTSSDTRAYKILNSLKKHNPNLKVILSLCNGGDDLGYSTMVSSDSNRNKFINNAISYLRKYSFDGVDFDWEFPIIKSGRLLDRPNYSIFLAELKRAFVKEAKTCKKDRLTISAAVSAVEPFMDIYYDIPSMSQSLDYINVMCYDYHVYRDILPFTGYNSPLFEINVEKGGYFGVFNIVWSANAWQERGAPKKKIIIGLPTYARTFKLLDASKNGIFAPAVGNALGSDEIDYSVVCKFLKTAVLKTDTEAGVPYAYNNRDWISYDDEKSIRRKSLWIKENGFGGAMTWSLTSDDWAGVCGKGKFPLHSVIYNSFQDSD